MWVHQTISAIWGNRLHSKGPVKGQITRLKLLRHQGYGRAGVLLLRHRVMPAA
jgi:transposase